MTDVAQLTEVSWGATAAATATIKRPRERECQIYAGNKPAELRFNKKPLVVECNWISNEVSCCVLVISDLILRFWIDYSRRFLGWKIVVN